MIYYHCVREEHYLHLSEISTRREASTYTGQNVQETDEANPSTTSIQTHNLLLKGPKNLEASGRPTDCVRRDENEKGGGSGYGTLAFTWMDERIVPSHVE